MKVRAVGQTDIGLKRKLNEDSLLLAPELGLYVLADGMGGHKAGEVASRIVVDTMADYWRKVRNGKPPSFLGPVRGDIPQSANHLVNSIVLTNMILHEAQKRPEYHRMGSTVSALLEEEDCMWLANVGDSPVYIQERGRLALMSEEHSVEAEQRHLGLSASDSFGSNNPFFKNVLTRVLGLNDKVNVYFRPIPIHARNLLMMCSDGLTNYVPEQLIGDILNDISVSSERKVELLIQEANKAGGGDNISVILLEVREEGRWQRLKRKLGPVFSSGGRP
jgi:PPM family protein phosphatase